MGAGAGAVWLAYVQVAAVPSAPTPPRPTVSAMIDRVEEDLHWLRTAIPRDADWWQVTYADTSENLRVLKAVLSEPGTTP